MTTTTQKGNEKTLTAHNGYRVRPIPEMTEKQIANFWAKVDKTSSPNGCWLWTGGTFDKNRGCTYGAFQINGQPYGAHRVAYKLRYGVDPMENIVMHDCPGGDNCLCVRHTHVGTQDANIKDRVEKRQAKEAAYAALQSKYDRLLTALGLMEAAA